MTEYQKVCLKLNQSERDKINFYDKWIFFKPIEIIIKPIIKNIPIFFLIIYLPK